MAEQGKDSGGKETQHRNDMYGNIDARGEGEEGVSKTIPAATVVLLRDGSEGVEVLMLKKNSKITFGGMWVFPGGKIEEQDLNIQNVYKNPDLIKRHTAIRESFEEIGVIIGKNGHYDASNYDVSQKWSDFEKRGPNKTF